VQLVNAIHKYALKSSFTTRAPHLQGKEMFGSYKPKVNLPSSYEGDSHKHDHVNYSHPMSTHKLLDHMYKLNNHLVMLINMNKRF